MSVYSVTRYQLYCNGRRRDSPRKGALCLRDYEPPADLDHIPKPAELRKLAAKEGWTRVRSPLGRRYDQDICPDCKPTEGTQ
jgi:hypothetical protein